MSELAIFVDEQDNLLRHASRHEIGRGDIVRIAALWLENSKGEVLLTKRSLAKKHDPGLWSPAAAGTLEPGEDYVSNIVKEAGEEIGLTGHDFTEVQKFMYWRPDGSGRYVTWFKTTTDWPINKFVLQQEEVAEAKWWAKDEIRNRHAKFPQEFVPSTESWFRLFI